MNRIKLDTTRLAIAFLVLGVTSIGCAPTAPVALAPHPRPAALEQTEAKPPLRPRQEERAASAEISPVTAAIAVEERPLDAAQSPARPPLPSAAPSSQCAPGSGAAVHLKVSRERGLAMVGPLRRVVAPVCRIERLDVIDAPTDAAYVPGANGFTSLFRLDW